MEKKEKKVTKPKSLFERLKEKTKAGMNHELEIEAERKRMMANVINRIAQGGKTININKE